MRRQEEKKNGCSDGGSGKKNKKKSAEAAADLAKDPERERTQFLQRVLLDYLAVSAGDDDQSILNARHFYISQWLRDANAEASNKKSSKQKKKKRRKRSSSSDEDDSSSDSESDGYRSDATTE